MDKNALYFFLVLSLLFSFSVDAKDKVMVVKDSVHSVSYGQDEMKYIIRHMTPQQRQDASGNDAELMRIVNQLIVKKNIVDAFKEINEKDNPEEYWKYQFAIRNLQSKLYLDYYKSSIVVPNAEALAKELYSTSQEKYAGMPEQRQASHILVNCLPGKCNRKEKRVVATDILDMIKKGGNFEELVEKYSDDPGSKSRKGSLDKWYVLGQPQVNGYFLDGLFGIAKVGGISDIVETKFGFHIIRLDGLKEKEYKSFDEVKESIINKIEEEYINLKLKVKMSSFDMSDRVDVDMEAIRLLLTEE